MAWTVNNSDHYSGQESAGVFSHTLAFTPTDGSKLLVFTQTDSSVANPVASVTDGTNSFGQVYSFSDVNGSSHDNCVCYALDHPHYGSAPTIKISSSSGGAFFAVVCLDVSGLATGTSSSVLDGSVGHDSFVASTETDPTYSSSVANEFLVHVLADGADGATLSAPSSGYSGSSIENSAINGSFGAAWKNSTGGSESGGALWTWSGTITAQAAKVAFLLPAAAAVTYVPPRTVTVPPLQFHQWAQRVAVVNQSTAANPLPSPLDVWAQDPPHRTWRRDPYQHTWAQRVALMDESTAGGTNFDPTQAGLPKVYATLPPWADPDRTEFEQRPYISDPSVYPLDGTGMVVQPLWWSADIFPHNFLQRPYISDPNLLTTALLEGVLLGGADDRQRHWEQAATHYDRRETVPQRVYLADQSTAANPLPSPLDVAWQDGGVYWHLYNDWRRDPYWTPPQREPGWDPSELVPPTNFDPTQAGYLAQPYWVWRRDPYWTPPGEPGKDPNLLNQALLEGPLLGIHPKDLWRRDPYWVPPGPPGKDPNLLNQALLEGPLLGIHPKDIWRRDPYWTPPGERVPDPNQFNFDPTVGGYLPQSYWVWQRPPYWFPVRPYAFDPNELIPPLPFDNTLAGLDWRRLLALFQWRPDSAAFWQRWLISDPSFYPSFTPPTLPGRVSPAYRGGSVSPSSRTGLVTPAEKGGKDAG